mmetsp:Transcript_12219/g.29173  ORF Transcript_12219/g.29173 Transcript_12219/m.29173 type:complete len:282 (+) Transcript_12219:378-1223(+)
MPLPSRKRVWSDESSGSAGASAATPVDSRELPPRLSARSEGSGARRREAASVSPETGERRLLRMSSVSNGSRCRQAHRLSAAMSPSGHRASTSFVSFGTGTESVPRMDASTEAAAGVMLLSERSKEVMVEFFRSPCTIDAASLSPSITPRSDSSSRFAICSRVEKVTMSARTSQGFGLGGSISSMLSSVGSTAFNSSPSEFESPSFAVGSSQLSVSKKAVFCAAASPFATCSEVSFVCKLLSCCTFALCVAGFSALSSPVCAGDVVSLHSEGSSGSGWAGN